MCWPHRWWHWPKYCLDCQFTLASVQNLRWCQHHHLHCHHGYKGKKCCLDFHNNSWKKYESLLVWLFTFLYKSHYRYRSNTAMSQEKAKPCRWDLINFFLIFSEGWCQCTRVSQASYLVRIKWNKKLYSFKFCFSSCFYCVRLCCSVWGEIRASEACQRVWEPIDQQNIHKWYRWTSRVDGISCEYWN